VLLSLLVIQLLLLPKENGGCRLEVATLMAGCSCCRGTLCGQVVRIGLVGFAFAICYLLFAIRSDSDSGSDSYSDSDSGQSLYNCAWLCGACVCDY